MTVSYDFTYDFGNNSVVSAEAEQEVSIGGTLNCTLVFSNPSSGPVLSTWSMVFDGSSTSPISGYENTNTISLTMSEEGGTYTSQTLTISGSAEKGNYSFKLHASATDGSSEESAVSTDPVIDVTDG